MTNSKLCPAPWTSIYINPDGRIDSCCSAENKLGNIYKQSTASIIHGEKNIAVKDIFLQNEFPTGCFRCEHREKTSGNSLRTEFLKWFENEPVSTYATSDAFTLKYADFRVRNTCNFACVYCNQELSSSWAQELGKPVRIEKDDTRELVNYLLQNLKTLKYLYIAGGEPLLIKENEIILKALLTENPDCIVRVNSNLSQLDNPIYELITKFKNVHWVISAEDIGERYNYIRYGGDWEQFTKNLATIKNTVHKNSITFNLVYTALNTKGMFNFIDYVIDQGFSFDNIFIMYVDHGHGSSVDPRLLPPHLFDQAKNILDQQIAKNYTGYLQTSLIGLKNTINLPYTNTERNGLFANLADLDRRRGTNSRLTFPELYATV